MADEAAQRPSEQRELLFAIEDLKSSILGKLEGQDPTWLRITQIALPVVLASLLGLLVWYLQTATQTELTSQQTVLRAQLGLKQYLYERRLDAYREIYDRLLATFTSLQDANVRNAGPSAAKDRLHADLTFLSKLANANKLIASDNLNKLLEDAWVKAVKTESNLSMEELTDRVVQQMRHDLLMDEPQPGNLQQ